MVDPPGATITKIASLNDPVGNVDTSVVYGTAPGPAAIWPVPA